MKREVVEERRRSALRQANWGNYWARKYAELALEYLRLLPVAQPAEAVDLKSIKCEFESHQGDNDEQN